MHRWPTSPQPKCLQSPVMYMSLNLCFDASFVCWRCLPCHVHLSATTLQRYYYYSQRRMRDRFCLPPPPLSRLTKNPYAEAGFTLCFHCFRVFLLASPQTISNMARRSWQTFSIILTRLSTPRVHHCFVSWVRDHLGSKKFSLH
jgi:hypothetical protein